MVTRGHDDPEVPEADEIEQHTPVEATDDAATEPDVLPAEAAEADVWEQAQQVDDAEEYPPA